MLNGPGSISVVESGAVIDRNTRNHVRGRRGAHRPSGRRACRRKRLQHARQPARADDRPDGYTAEHSRDIGSRRRRTGSDCSANRTDQGVSAQVVLFIIESGLASLAPANTAATPSHQRIRIPHPAGRAVGRQQRNESIPSHRTAPAGHGKTKHRSPRSAKGLLWRPRPGSWTTYSVTGDEPARAWVFAVTFDATHCPLPATTPA